MPSRHETPLPTEASHHTLPPTIRWIGGTDGHLKLIDQTLLPETLQEFDCHDVERVREAVLMLRVRGAPAIGVAAAYGVVIGMQHAVHATAQTFCAQLDDVTSRLASSRPTAVNLFWALDRMNAVARSVAAEPGPARISALLAEAAAIHLEDSNMCDQIGQHGCELLTDGMSILTHCNAGALATAGTGTALSLIYAAVARGKRIHVYADETRPLLQGARLTAWELRQCAVPVTVICDNMAAQVMKEGRIDAVITGADRIAANGDAANKIGTYGVAVLARYHNIPFYVAAPSSTFDLQLVNGNEIPIEQRRPEEITEGFGRRTVPREVDVYNPAFDVTPAGLITAIVTERGVLDHPDRDRVRAHLADGHA